jgi:HK97 family phage major capsid protein
MKMEKTPEQMLDEVKTEVRTSLDKSLDEKVKEIREGIDAQMRAGFAELAKPRIEVVGPASEMRAVAEAIVQKRALSLSGAGAYNVLKSFEKVVADKHDIVSKAKWFYGAGAQTNIPVFTARPARPIKQDEGAKGIGGDATAAQSVTSITPYAYYSEIFVSAEDIVQGAASVEAALPELFGEAFANALHYGMVVGDATMTGIFADGALTNDINCDATGAPVWADFIELAGALKAKAFSPVIVTSSTFVGNLLLSTAASHEGLKMELLTKGSIRGVPVYEDPFAPTVHATGNIVAVGLDLQNYAIACAREFTIEPIRAPGTAGVYYQATGFYNGKPILAANGWQLKAK